MWNLKRSKPIFQDILFELIFPLISALLKFSNILTALVLTLWIYYTITIYVKNEDNLNHQISTNKNINKYKHIIVHLITLQ